MSGDPSRSGSRSATRVGTASSRNRNRWCLRSAAAPAAGGTNLPTSPKGGATVEVDDATLAGSKKAQQRIGELIEQARAYGQRGEYAEGVARLREVVRLQPSMTDAFVELGGMLHQAGDADAPCRPLTSPCRGSRPCATRCWDRPC